MLKRAVYYKKEKKKKKIHTHTDSFTGSLLQRCNQWNCLKTAVWRAELGQQNKNKIFSVMKPDKKMVIFSQQCQQSVSVDWSSVHQKQNSVHLEIRMASRKGTVENQAQGCPSLTYRLRYIHVYKVSLFTSKCATFRLWFFLIGFSRF